jgi:hypothetical protein
MDAGRICPEDVVCLASDPSMPGMVCCVGEDTENRHAQPSAHVYWLRENDNDRMEPISELRILDRALLHGDTGDSNRNIHPDVCACLDISTIFSHSKRLPTKLF